MSTYPVTLNEFHNLSSSMLLLPAKDTKVTFISCSFTVVVVVVSMLAHLVTINSVSVTQVSGHMCIAKKFKEGYRFQFNDKTFSL